MMKKAMVSRVVVAHQSSETVVDFRASLAVKALAMLPGGFVIPVTIPQNSSAVELCHAEEICYCRRATTER